MDIHCMTHPSWQRIVGVESKKQYFKNLNNFILSAYAHEIVYPDKKNLFRAFDLCPFENVKVVILGQDPYHQPNRANGLCFSVEPPTKLPPSLKNIFKEIQSDLGSISSTSGDLSNWATQGVLLLNTTLTVEAGKAGSHQKKGWEEFTDNIIHTISTQRPHVVFILWGAYARRKRSLIDTRKHLVLESPHPSPLSAYAGFFGNRHFSQTNSYLKDHNQTPIDW